MSNYLKLGSYHYNAVCFWNQTIDVSETKKLRTLWKGEGLIEVTAPRGESEIDAQAAVREVCLEPWSRRQGQLPFCKGKNTADKGQKYQQLPVNQARHNILAK